MGLVGRCSFTTDTFELVKIARYGSCIAPERRLCLNSNVILSFMPFMAAINSLINSCLTACLSNSENRFTFYRSVHCIYCWCYILEPLDYFSSSLMPKLTFVDGNTPPAHLTASIPVFVADLTSSLLWNPTARWSASWDPPTGSSVFNCVYSCPSWLFPSSALLRPALLIDVLLTSLAETAC